MFCRSVSILLSAYRLTSANVQTRGSLGSPRRGELSPVRTLVTERGHDCTQAGCKTSPSPPLRGTSPRDAASRLGEASAYVGLADETRYPYFIIVINNCKKSPDKVFIFCPHCRWRSCFASDCHRRRVTVRPKSGAAGPAGRGPRAYSPAAGGSSPARGRSCCARKPCGGCAS